MCLPNGPSDAVQRVSVLIVGAGPTGLGAATRLQQHGLEDWLIIDRASEAGALACTDVIEDGVLPDMGRHAIFSNYQSLTDCPSATQASEAGGLACTDVTKEGFLFDMGGHVIFSHYQYFDELLDRAVGSGDDFWNTLQRVSYVWTRNRWVAYPFQNNISALPQDDQIKCLVGVAEAKVANATAQTKPKNFDEWILRVMGSGIADLFMRPYNFKVWAFPTTSMQCEWLGERVATVDATRAIKNVIQGTEDAGWGPNAVFRFPLEGGTGAIWKAVARLLPESKQKYGSDYAVVGLDKEAKTATLQNGQKIQYDALISTMPLDLTLQSLGQPEWANTLSRSSSHIVGIGMRGQCPHGLKCWLYFPEDDCPFYRTTVFSHYAPKNCPAADTQLPTLCMGDGSAVADSKAEGGPYWSLMFEVSESVMKAVNNEVESFAGGKWAGIVRECVEGALATNLIAKDDQIVSLYHRRLEHGYPTPSLERDGVLEKALPWLRQSGIWSRGRFGSYKYEVGNQDHSLMLGVECADNVLFGSKELTLHHPNVVNSKKNTELLYSTPTFLSQHKK